eukprot:TRINITY_DN49378_c0_g1_i1.p2 TRINITY_DN49378_c0_g1~~TRINITY_DN49378_c0_g1_i1.p2  ORF type:complete len:301 (-),score=86.80 TRINITY_DN49378_c0_g1_i1:136-1038(-)
MRPTLFHKVSLAVARRWLPHPSMPTLAVSPSSSSTARVLSGVAAIEQKRQCASASSSAADAVDAEPESEDAFGPDSTDDFETGDAVVPRTLRLYRRTREEHHRTFRWGVGSKWRSQGANRFMPVHKEHPKEIMVRDDYYESDNKNIVWEDLNEAWEVYWYEHDKLNAKPFPVKKWGLEASKREAFAFYEQLQEKNRLEAPPKIESPDEGVFYDSRMQSWVCLFWRDGRPQARCYGATKYGFEGAKMLAMAKKKDPVNGVLRLADPSGGIPATWQKKKGGLSKYAVLNPATLVQQKMQKAT